MRISVNFRFMVLFNRFTIYCIVQCSISPFIVHLWYIGNICVLPGKQPTVRVVPPWKFPSILNSEFNITKLKICMTWLNTYIVLSRFQISKVFELSIGWITIMVVKTWHAITSLRAIQYIQMCKNSNYGGHESKRQEKSSK